MNIIRKHTGSDITIFSEMTALAIEYKATNLAQGFPDYDIDPRLKRWLAEGTDKGFNQYAPLAGNPLLIENLIHFNKNRKKTIIFNKSEVTIVPGATYGIYCALAAILQPGDEVIVLQPCYDSYVPAIELNGGLPVFVDLDENFEPNFDLIKSKITNKTRAIILNTPHNPSGKIWTKAEFNSLAEIIKNTEIILISDEVYDLLTYDNHEHESTFNHPELKDRSFCIFSFGKMFHITGWKVGYVIANEELTTAFRRIHQFLCFSVNSPAQYAIAKYLEHFDEEENRRQMQSKRDFFLNSMKGSKFEFKEIAQGGYFQMAGFRTISDMEDKAFCYWLTKKIGVAAIPVNAFYNQNIQTGIIRFCFAKKEETILEAAKKIEKNLKLIK